MVTAFACIPALVFHGVTFVSTGLTKQMVLADVSHEIFRVLEVDELTSSSLLLTTRALKGFAAYTQVFEFCTSREVLFRHE